MLKIETRGCHGNGGVDPKNICIFVHHSTEIKNTQSFRKIFFFFFFFFYFQLILTVTENDLNKTFPVSYMFDSKNKLLGPKIRLISFL